MAPLPSLPQHLMHLSRLPIDDLRGYATFAYGHPPYTQQISDVLATGMFFAPGAVLIALYPPEVPPEKALVAPPDFPTWRYYLDGRWLYIATEEEYDRLAPGHSGRPDGPWPEGIVTQVHWTIGHGPYAPVEGWRPYGSAPEPEGHPDQRVYATQPRIYYGRAYAVGEVFFLNGHNIVADDNLIDTGVVKIVPRSAQPVPHDWTGRWFVDPSTLTAYAAGYEAGKCSEWMPEGAPALLPATPPVASSTPGEEQPPRKVQDLPWQEWTHEETLTVLVAAAQKISRRRRLSWDQIARHMTPRYHRNTLRKIHTRHQITMDEIRARL